MAFHSTCCIGPAPPLRMESRPCFPRFSAKASSSERSKTSDRIDRRRTRFMDDLSRRTVLTGLGLAGLAALTRSGVLVSSAWAAAKVGAPAPSFSTTATTGKNVSLADYRGKVVVLEWTNHECPYVRKHYETGNMQVLQKESTGQGVVWLTLISSAPGEQGSVSASQADQLTSKRHAVPTAVLPDSTGVVGEIDGATHP